MNTVILTGRLGADPEIRYTPGGTQVANFNLAVDRFGANKEKTTTWIKITAWDKKAKYTADYLTKGSKVLIQGELVIDAWEDKDGNKRTAPSVTAWQIENLTSKPKAEDGPGDQD
jgi:single-strand DNA-binding protein